MGLVWMNVDFQEVDLYVIDQIDQTLSSLIWL